MRLSSITICAAGVLATATPTIAQYFSDDFDDGVIDAEHWTASGDVTESDGVLNLDRDLEKDGVAVNGLVSGEWTMTFETRLDEIVDQSALHGVSIIHDDGSGFGQGLTFGYSVWTDALFIGKHSGNQIDYFYAPDGSNDAGEWHEWTFQRASDGTVTILVDGESVFEDDGDLIVGSVPDEAQITLPGHYFSDGGGGVTSSDVDNFSLAPAGCPADCNADGALNVNDFVCFQNEWQDQTDFGDCNADGRYSILDFVCYQELFQQGCP